MIPMAMPQVTPCCVKSLWFCARKPAPLIWSPAWGGDEFVLVFPGLSDVARLGQIAARIIERVGDPVDFEGQACRVSASIGMTTSTRYAQVAIDAMHADADEALYCSKRSGRGRVTLHGEEVAARRGVEPLLPG